MARKFIFTNKFYSPKGIMATILGILDLSALAYIIYLTYQNGGVASGVLLIISGAKLLSGKSKILF